MDNLIKKRRVRLCQLNGENNWSELGNGHALWVYKHKSRSARILVISEVDGNFLKMLNVRLDLKPGTKFVQKFQKLKPGIGTG
jgi:hypothetical protein